MTNTVDKLKELQQQIDHEIERLNLHTRKPEQLYKPLSYILSLPAKRTRPMLCLLACRAYSGRDCMQLALALELFHNFTLVHDDIMDNAPTRRGKSTLHEVWDANTAILSGDALYAYTQLMIATAEPEKCGELMRRYSEMALEVCEGQMRDVALAEASDVSIADYMQMIEQKTAALLGAALAMGAYAGGAAASHVEALDTYGRKMGIGFQLLDDLLDVYAVADKFGKQPGGDIIENKKTYLWLKSLEIADDKSKQTLLSWAERTDDNEAKVKAVTEVYNKLGMPELARKKIDHIKSEAAKALAPLLPNPHLEALNTYLESVLQRNH